MLHSWDISPKEAIALQRRQAGLVRVTLDEAVAGTLRARRGFRLPQPTRLADMLVSQLKIN